MKKILIIIGTITIGMIFKGCAVEWHTYRQYQYYNPNWFPDGKVVYIEVYNRYRTEKYFPAGEKDISLGGGWYICEMNSDGSGQKRIVQMKFDNTGNPTHRATHDCVSATNDKIVYGIQGEIWVLNRDGTGLRKITNGEYPDFNPDGTKIVYEKHYFTMPGSDTIIINGDTVSYDEHKEGIWIYNLTTEKDFCIVSDTLAMMPAWSTDGEKIAYVRGEKFVVVKYLSTSSQKNFESPYRIRGIDWMPDSKQIKVTYAWVNTETEEVIEDQRNAYKISYTGTYGIYAGIAGIYLYSIGTSETTVILEAYTEEE